MNDQAARPAGAGSRFLRREGGNPLVELTKSRFREFVREPEAVFWVFAFPVIMTCALGIAFSKMGRHKQAARYLVQTLHAIDTRRNGASEADAKRVYEGMAGALNEANDELLAAINQRLTVVAHAEPMTPSAGNPKLP